LKELENKIESSETTFPNFQNIEVDLNSIKGLLEKQDLEARQKEEELKNQSEIDLKEKILQEEKDHFEKQELEKEISEKESLESEKLQKKEEQQESYNNSVTQSLNSILENLENAEMPTAVDLTATNKKLDDVNKNLEILISQNQFSFYSDITLFTTIVIAIPVLILYKMVNSVVNRLF